MTDKKQRVKKTPGTRHNFQRSLFQPSDLLPSIRPYFHKFPEPSKIGPPAGQQTLWETFYIYPMT